MAQDQTTIFHSDPSTGEYVGTGIAFIGPAGDIQVPAFAAINSPPDVPEGFVARRSGPVNEAGECEWEIIQDWRGTQLYRTADGSMVDFADLRETWSGLGDLPPGLTDTPRPSSSYIWDSGWRFDIDLAKAVRTAEIDAERVSRESGSFGYQGKYFAADTDAERRMVSAAQMASVALSTGRAFSMTWPALDGSQVELDANGVVDLVMALAAHRDNCARMANELKAAVEKAQTEAELATVVWRL